MSWVLSCETGFFRVFSSRISYPFMTTPKTAPKRVALYARVSTLDKHQDLETQLRQLREHAQHRGFFAPVRARDPGGILRHGHGRRADPLQAIASHRLLVDGVEGLAPGGAIVAGWHGKSRYREVPSWHRRDSSP